MLSLFAVHTHRLNKLAMSATTNSMTILKPDLSPLAPKAHVKRWPDYGAHLHLIIWWA